MGSRLLQPRVRQLSTTPAYYVKRPQVPFPMRKAVIDHNGRAIGAGLGRHPTESEQRRIKLLESIAEEPSQHAISEKQYGLRKQSEASSSASTPSVVGNERTFAQSTTERRHNHGHSDTSGEGSRTEDAREQPNRALHIYNRVSAVKENKPLSDNVAPGRSQLRQSRNHLRPDFAQTSDANTPKCGEGLMDIDETRQWDPTKKLSFGAMQGLRALHNADPVKFNRASLSERFGISQEAVRRILHSTWRNRDETREAVPARLDHTTKTLSDTKWDKDADSPVPAIMRAFHR